MEEDDITEKLDQRSVGDRMSAGVGYVMLPIDVDRDKFIQRCLRTGTISLFTENTEFINNVKIDRWTLQQIDWPDKQAELGDCIFWVNMPKHNVPVAVAILTKNNQIIDLVENEFSLTKNSKNGSVSISGNSDKGVINIIVNSDKDGQFNVSVINKNDQAKFNLSVRGEVNINTTKGLNYKDDLGNELHMLKNGFTIKNKSESFKTLVDDLFQAIEQLIVNTPSGAGTISPSSTQKLEKLKSRFGKLFE